jgi:hypothetical protein
MTKEQIKKNLIDFVSSVEVHEFSIEFDEHPDVTELCKIQKKYRRRTTGTIIVNFKIKKQEVSE